MSQNSRFSIITVCLNESETIQRTCESIIAQTYRNFEWIVIDGGSIDGTLDILDTYKSQITTLLSEPDDGIYDAMNKGIERASGEYIIFMNGGDRFAGSDVLEAVALAPAMDLIVGDMAIDGDDSRKRVAPDLLSEEYFGRTTLPHQSSFISRQLFLDHGLYDTSYDIVADMEFFARIFRAADPTYFHLPKVLAIFDDFGVSSSSKYKWKKKQEDHRVRWQYYPEYRKTMKCFRQILRGATRKVFR